jgi:ribosomal protein S18 acetylase RimI-like enzyme
VPGIVFELSAADASDKHLSDLADIYAEAFSEPPFSEGPEDTARFRQRFRRELANPGFSLVRALDGRVAVGMAYGHEMAAGHWWANAIDPPPAGLHAPPKLAVIEWAVRPASRRQGIGRRLMDELLGGRAEPYATLQASPDSIAYGIYLRWGWQPAGRARASMPMEILVLQLGT